MYPEDQYAIRALRAGAFGYVNKGGDPPLLVQRGAHGGAGPQVRDARDRADAGREPDRRRSVENAHEKLSDRELQTLVMIASGKRLSDIAEELMLEPEDRERVPRPRAREARP